MLITVVLNFQVDPFIAYTIIMAKLISELGSTGQASQYLSNLPVDVHTWQLSTYTLLQNMYGSGVLLAILHLISGVSIIQLAFLPIPGALSMCMLYLILRRLSNLVDATLMSASLIFSFVAILGMYAYMLEDVVGKFYAFDFHAINYALYLMCLYCIIRLSESKSSPSYFVASVIASAASTFIHYTLPIVLIGGLAAYVTFSWLVSGGGKMQRLPLVLAVILCLQSFYFGMLGRANISQTLTSLLGYFSGGFIESQQTQAYALSPLYQVQILLAKAYTYSAVVFVIAVTAVLFRIRGRRSKPIAATYSLIVGGSLVYFLSYFQYYGHVNFGFVGGWLLQPLLIVTVVMILPRQRRETETTVDTRSTATFDGFGDNVSGISKAGEKDSRPRAFRRLVLATLLILSLLQAVNTTFVADARLSYGAMVAEPRLESVDLQSFSITHLSAERFLIGASSEASSDLYSRLADYDANQVATVMSAYFTGNSTFGGDTSLAYAQLRHDFNYLILTKYELSNGLYGGATPDGLWEYLNATEVTNLKSVLDSNQNLVYNSGDGYLYSFD